MAIHIICGRLGSYKSCIAVAFAYAIQSYLGYDIKANFNIHGMTERLTCYEDVLNSLGAVLILDETEIFANSRDSAKPDNKALKHFQLISRKQFLEPIFIAPRLGSIDVNIRDMADFTHVMQIDGQNVIQSIYERPMIGEDYVLLGQNVFNKERFVPFFKWYDTTEKPSNFLKGASKYNDITDDL
ncbi:hypothetical protein [Vallitalea okinawensis]|uniref:hypothetical protein n=1 Tax=Vallitalea okinawensis TaxID=2078660 RepID=UPI000CFD72ED|nr:hypothetical protein [Vallitalea okinawensis]